MKPEDAADKLRGLHKALMGDDTLVLEPATTIAFAAAKKAASARPTPQAPNLAAAWMVTSPKRNTKVIDTGSTIAFGSRPVYAGDVQGGILFGSNKSPQFHRAHSVPSWAWVAMEKALAEAKLEDVLNAALGKITGVN